MQGGTCSMEEIMQVKVEGKQLDLQAQERLLCKSLNSPASLLVKQADAASQGSACAKMAKPHTTELEVPYEPAEETPGEL